MSVYERFLGLLRVLILLKILFEAINCSVIFVAQTKHTYHIQGAATKYLN